MDSPITESDYRFLFNKILDLKVKELNDTIKLSIQQMWLNELIELEKFI